jgi:hypothetical protein
VSGDLLEQGEQENKKMGRPKKYDDDGNIIVKAEPVEVTPVVAFKYTPYLDSASLPAPEVDKKGVFVKYGKPHFAYRRTSGTTAEFLAIYKKPQGIITKLVRRLKLRSGKNADDAFYRKLKDNNIPEMD